MGYKGLQNYEIFPLTNLPKLSLAGREIENVPYWGLMNIAVKNKYKGKTLLQLGK